MMWKIAAAGAVLASMAGAASAQETSHGLSPRYLACQARARGNTVQVGICAQGELTAQDARLNKAYQQVMRQLAADPARHTALRDAQRSWLKRRDYECKLDQQTIDNGCLVEKTATRADELERQIRF